MGGRVFEDSEGGPSFGEDSSTCSCLYGNPCSSSCVQHRLTIFWRTSMLSYIPHADNCKDWKNRFEVAKKHGWKGFS